MERLRQLCDWVDAQTLRERALVLLVLLVAVFAAWDMWLMGPLASRGVELRRELMSGQSDRRALSERVRQLEAAVAVDLDVENRRRRTSLQSEVDRLEAEIMVHSQDLIPPASMRALVERMLADESALDLVRLENVALRPLRIDVDGVVVSDSEPADETEPESGLFVHGLVLEVRGDYMSTLRYLESLESLGWRLLWDEIDYRVMDYPEARVTITVHSLSRRKGWIGV